ncbi:FG-GAP and VCBS repeat-containing protein [Actinomycetota bacterium Odt1-20B]
MPGLALLCAGALLLTSGCTGGGRPGDDHDRGERTTALGPCKATPSARPTPTGTTTPPRDQSEPRRKPEPKLQRKPEPEPLNRDDFNGDGRGDLLLGELGPGTGQFMLLGSPAGAATSATSATTGRRIPLSGRFPELDTTSSGDSAYRYAVAQTADWDGDGSADILYRALVRTRDGGRRTPYKEGIVWGGKGGVSGPFTRLPGSDAPPVAAGDFDGDGHADLASGPFAATKDADNEVRCAAIDYGPFDRSGHPAERRYVDLTRRGTVSAYTFTAGDFDGDGRDEFFTTGFRAVGEEVTDETTPDVYVDASYYRVGTDRSVERVGDLKALGHGADTHYDPEGSDDGPASLGASDSLDAHLTADFGGNGRADVMVPGKDRRTGNPHVLYGSPDGPGTGRAATEGPLHDSAAVGDVNGDGRDDLVTGDFGGPLHQAGSVSVFLGGERGLARQAAVTFDRTDVGMADVQPKGDADRDRFGSG